LEKNKLPKQIVDVICFTVDHISWKAGKNKVKLPTLEGRVAQDADRLDALGAIGVARLFSYGGYLNRPTHGPRKDKPSTIHVYEKLLHLKKTMNTKTGKKLAKVKHEFLAEYLKQFLREWKGLR
jgi:uncharacterized protein